MSPILADPEKTWALVVGIGGYEHQDWNTVGPAESARDFAKHLIRDRGVDGGRVDLLVSDGAAGGAAGDAQNRRPTRKRVDDALQILRARKGDLLVVFWSGHGAIDIDRRQRLFYADAAKQNPLNLELHSLLPALASTWCPGFKRQLVIVDACAVPMKSAFEYEQPGDRYSRLDQAPIGQAVLFASRQLRTSRPGLFWDVLKPLLEVPGPDRKNEWPELGELLEQIKSDFQDQAAKQQPRVFLTDWSGEKTFRTGTDQRTSHLTRDERERVLEILTPVALAEDALQRIYVEALGVTGMESQAHEDLIGVEPRLAHLAVCDSPLLALAFVLGMARECAGVAAAGELRDWAKATGGRLGVGDDRVAELATRFAAGPPELATLLIQARAEGANSYDLTAWLWLVDAYENEPAFPKQGDPEEALTLQEVRAEVPDLVLRVRRRLAPETQLLVELMVPVALLSTDFDAWPLASGSLAPPSQLGKSYPVLVRSLDRAEDSAAYDRWRPRWDLLKSRAGAKLTDNARWIQQGELAPAALFEDLDGSDDFCVGLIFSPATDEPWVAYTIGAGVPAVLWLREPPQDSAAERARLCHKLGGTSIADLPAWILEARKKGDAKHVSLLWDDAERPLPPRPTRLASEV